MESALLLHGLSDSDEEVFLAQLHRRSRLLNQVPVSRFFLFSKEPSRPTAFCPLTSELSLTILWDCRAFCLQSQRWYAAIQQTLTSSHHLAAATQAQSKAGLQPELPNPKSKDRAKNSTAALQGGYRVWSQCIQPQSRLWLV